MEKKVYEREVKSRYHISSSQITQIKFLVKLLNINDFDLTKLIRDLFQCKIESLKRLEACRIIEAMNDILSPIPKRWRKEFRDIEGRL